MAAVFITLAVFAIVGLATMKNEYRECTGIIIRRVLFLRYPFPCCRRLWFIPLTQHSGSSFFGSSFSFENCNIWKIETFGVGTISSGISSDRFIGCMGMDIFLGNSCLMVLWHNHHNSQTCIKWWPIGNGSVTANYQLINQYRFHRRGVTQKTIKSAIFCCNWPLNVWTLAQ